MFSGVAQRQTYGQPCLGSQATIVEGTLTSPLCVLWHLVIYVDENFIRKHF